MALDRFSVVSVFRAHWKALTKPTTGDLPPEPDKTARLVLIIGPLLAGVASVGLGVTLSSPGTLVAALSLLTGTLLSVFAQLSSLRLKLTEWFEREDIGSRPDKDAIDESVAHVLVAALISLVATIVTVAAIVVGDEKFPVLQGIVAAVAIALIMYVLLLLIMLIPRLYGAYVSVNDVDDSLNGEFVDRTNKHMRRLDGH